MQNAGDNNWFLDPKNPPPSTRLPPGKPGGGGGGVSLLAAHDAQARRVEPFRPETCTGGKQGGGQPQMGAIRPLAHSQMSC